MATCDFGESRGPEILPYTCRLCGFTVSAKWPILAECRTLSLAALASQEPGGGCGCSYRQAQLNALSDRFWGRIKLGDRIAAVANPLRRLWRRLRPKRRAILLRFLWGLGDTVQLSILLRHIRANYPQLDVDVLVRQGSGRILAPLCRKAFEEGDDPPGPYDLTHDVPLISHPTEGFWDCPATKAEWLVSRIFRMQPRDELCRYSVSWGRPHDAAAHEFLAAQGLQPFRFALVHYQGDSFAPAKSLGEEFARRLVVGPLLAAGITPVVLNWSGKSGIRAPGVRLIGPAELTPEAALIAAVVNLAGLCVGIDSGPGHIFCAQELSTPALIIWNGHFAGHFMPPARQVLHLVPANFASRTGSEAALAYFLENYNYRIAPGTADLCLADTVAALAADGQAAIDRLAAEGRSRRWHGLGRFDVSDVLNALGGQPDALLNCGVGPPPNCEADQAVARWPGLRVWGWEPDPASRAIRRRYPGEIIPRGLWDAPGRLQLLPDPGLGQTSFLPGLAGRVPEPGAALTVAVDSLDAWAAATRPEFSRALLWADVEGAELRVLQGARGLLSAGRIGWVYAEISATPRRLGEPSAAEIDEFLAGFGLRPIFERPRDGDSFDRLYALK